MAQQITSQKQFSLAKWGVMGTFQTRKSLPIEFLLTSFSIEEFDDLTFANKLDPEKRDFELLMQRDIDMSRVQKEIMKYLNPDKTDSELLARPIFFPPLLAAIIPANGTKIVPSLPDTAIALGNREGDDAVSYLQRTWGNIFRLSFFKAEHGEGITYLTDDGKSIPVQTNPVCLEVRKSKDLGDTLGVRLVVFDGQHRLMALLKLAQHNKAAIEGISVPVAIVWSPNSTEAIRKTHPEAYRPVYEVFRRLFVDVNKNALAVGGHFNTLLSDADVGSVAMRIFCERVLDKYTETGLAVVEWNIRNKKDATQIRRDYSLTSIGVIEVAIKKALAGRQRSGLLKHVLALGSLEQDLYPNDASYDYPKPIEYDKFSPSQRSLLEKPIRERLVNQGLVRVFFETDQFVKARKIFEEVVDSYRLTIAKQGAGYESCSAVLGEILEYRPLEEGNTDFEAKSGKFFKDVAAKYEANINGIIRYSVFQRALVDTWLGLVDSFRETQDADLSDVTTAYIGLLNHALRRDVGLFSETTQRYLKHSIFRAKGNIKPTEGTRKALGHLLVACLGDEKVTNRFLAEVGLAGNAEWQKRMIEIGMDAATSFVGHLRRERIADFAATYATDFSIPQLERESLAKAQSTMDDLKVAVRGKKATKQELEKATAEFEKQVETYVQADLEQAIGDLKAVLNYETDIVFDTRIEEEEIEEEQNGA